MLKIGKQQYTKIHIQIINSKLQTPKYRTQTGGNWKGTYNAKFTFLILNQVLGIGILNLTT